MMSMFLLATTLCCSLFPPSPCAYLRSLARLFVHYLPALFILIGYSLNSFLFWQVLFGPLTGLEPLSEGHIFLSDRTVRYLQFRPTCNQRAVLIEDLVARRKLQCEINCMASSASPFLVSPFLEEERRTEKL